MAGHNWPHIFLQRKRHFLFLLAFSFRQSIDVQCSRFVKIYEILMTSRTRAQCKWSLIWKSLGHTYQQESGIQSSFFDLRILIVSLIALSLHTSIRDLVALMHSLCSRYSAVVRGRERRKERRIHWLNENSSCWKWSSFRGRFALHTVSAVAEISKKDDLLLMPVWLHRLRSTWVGPANIKLMYCRANGFTQLLAKFRTQISASRVRLHEKEGKKKTMLLVYVK